jgi:hypothetical protein
LVAALFQAVRCPSEEVQYNIAILARRLYGRHIAPKAEHEGQAVQAVESGVPLGVVLASAAYGREHLASRTFDIVLLGRHIIRPGSKLVPRAKLSPVGHFICMSGHDMDATADWAVLLTALTPCSMTPTGAASTFTHF